MNTDKLRTKRWNLEKWELGSLIIICLLFPLVIWLSGRYHDINDTPEAKRYDYDIHARFGAPEKQEPYTQKGTLISNGTVSGGELSSICGEAWYKNFYDTKNRHQRVELLNDCQISEEQQKQIIQTSLVKAERLQKQMATKYNYFLDIEKNSNVEENIWRHTKAQTERLLFKESLSLNDRGQSDILARLPELAKDIEHPSEALAILASMEGDTAFPYSHLFQGEASDNSLQLNETASLIRRITKINQEWAVKAVKTKNIIHPIATLILTGMILSTLFCIRVVRRQEKPIISLSIMLFFWSLIGLILCYFNFLDKDNQILVGLLYGLLITGALIFLAILFSNKIKLLLRGFDTPEFQMPTTIFGYPFFALCLWVGFVIMLELSVTGHLDNRFLIYTYFTSCYLALFTISLVPTIANIISKIISMYFARLMIALLWSNYRIIYVSIITCLIIGIFIFLKLVFSANTMIELFKGFVILSLSAFMATSRLSMNAKFLSLKLFLALLSIVILSVSAMILVGESGTVLILAYSGVVILGAYLQYYFSNKKPKNQEFLNKNQDIGIKLWILKLHHNAKNELKNIWYNKWAIAISLGILYALTKLLLTGIMGGRLPERLMSMNNPFGSTNDQMAIIHWLRHSTPTFGYSLGDVPWCGYYSIVDCTVPKQMQSDYTTTSIVALFGLTGGVLFFIAYLFWLVSFLKKHLTYSLGIRYSQNNLGHVFLLWSGIIWVIVTSVQMIVTVLGNFGILPLTGVTFPFVSYGMASLIVCSFFIGLLINAPIKE